MTHRFTCFVEVTRGYFTAVFSRLSVATRRSSASEKRSNLVQQKTPTRFQVEVRQIVFLFLYPGGPESP